MHEKHLSRDSETKKFLLVFIADDAFPLTVNIMKPYALRNLVVQKRPFITYSKCYRKNIWDFSTFYTPDGFLDSEDENRNVTND